MTRNKRRLEIALFLTAWIWLLAGAPFAHADKPRADGASVARPDQSNLVPPTARDDKEESAGATKPRVGSAPTPGRIFWMDQVAWSFDSKSLFSSGRGNLLSVQRFFGGPGENLRMRDMPHYANSLATSPSSRLIILGTNAGVVEVRDGDSLDLKGEFVINPERRYSIFAVALSVDDRLLASCGLDGSIQVWNVADRRRVQTLGEAGPLKTALEFSPDGTRLAALDAGGYLELWNMENGTSFGRILPRSGSHPRIRFTPDGKTVIVINDGMLAFWDAEREAKPRFVIAPESVSPKPPKENEESSSRLVCLNGRLFAGATALAPDLKSVASVAPDGSVAIWSSETGIVLLTFPKSDELAASTPDNLAGWEISMLAFSPSGRQLAGVTRKGAIMFWYPR